MRGRAWLPLNGAIGLVKTHLEARDEVRELLVKASETQANFELVEDIIKGEIIDYNAELETVALDKARYTKMLTEAEVRAPPLDLSQMEHLSSDLSLEVATTSEVVAPSQPIYEFGTNAGSLLGKMRVESPGNDEEA